MIEIGTVFLEKYLVENIKFERQMDKQKTTTVDQKGLLQLSAQMSYTIIASYQTQTLYVIILYT